MSPLREMLTKKLLFFDGGMGTELQKAGLKSGTLPETLNIEQPELIKSIHERYLDAGADFVTTNTFGANKLKLEHIKYTVAEVITSAVKCAKEATAKYTTTEKPRFVAMDIGPTGKLLEPLGPLQFEVAYEAFKECVITAVEAGVDCFIIETMSDSQEARAAILAAKENSTLPIFATMTFGEDGKTLTGATPEIAGTIMQSVGADCIGINCGLGPNAIAPLAKEMIESVHTPIIIQPNAGLPKVENGKTIYDVSPVDFARELSEIAMLGVSVVGGCCGTTPEYIRELVRACEGITPNVRDIHKPIITSYCRKATFGDKPIIIGERINPTGKKLFKQALRDHDINYIINEAVKQEDAGADVLDVNVGLPEIDEKEMMVLAVKAISSVSPLPLQIDSTSPEVIDAALRVYNGRALINSTNAKQHVMDEIFPIAQKYGAMLVGLTIDEDGIPETANKRVELGEAIIAEADKYGLSREDMLIDPLTLAVSAQQREAGETSHAIAKLKAKGINTVLGVSNISFGLPQRVVMNTTFFAQALFSGLSACIINPCIDAMMNVYRSHNVLFGYDEGCEEYVAKLSTYDAPLMQNATTKATSEADNSKNPALFDMIVKGVVNEAAKETEALLKDTEPMSIINDIIIPALDEVGKRFEVGKIFLPQLMASANAVTSSFAVLKAFMSSSGKAPESKGKIAIATVKGDIHDIGKNIVKTLLENYGFEVFDLGKDVDYDVVVNAMIENDIHVLGLSALMTTTVESMAETIRRVRAAGIDAKIFVGGAVLTKEYADMIGADMYTKDAPASVEYAKSCFA